MAKKREPKNYQADVLGKTFLGGDPQLKIAAENIKTIFTQSANAKVTELNKKFNDSEKKFKNIQKEIKKLQDDTNRELQEIEKEIKASVSKIDDQQRNDKLQSIQILALFAAFFTFVSVEFQLFSVLKDPLEAIALSLLLLGALLAFVTALMMGLNYFQNSAKNKKPRDRFINIIGLGAAALLVAGAGLGYMQSENAKQESRSMKQELLNQQKRCEALGSDILRQLSVEDSKTLRFLQHQYNNECSSPEVEPRN